MTGSKPTGMTQNKTIIKVPPILGLPSPSKSNLHPYAFKKYVYFLVELNEAAPGLHLLYEDDLKVFLPDKDYARVKACADEIREWLKKCHIENEKSSLAVYPYHSPFDAMRDLKNLLKQVHERKLLTERRVAALIKIDPPYGDAKKYLNEREHEQFRRSLTSAADAYLNRGKGCLYNDWRYDTRGADYFEWTGIIEERKGEEARLRQAEVEHSRFLNETNGAIKRFKQELSEEKKPCFARPPLLAKYHSGDWCELELPTEQQVENWAAPHIWKRVPAILNNSVSWELKWQVQTLPYARYEILGVPCLTWCFSVLLLLEAHLMLPQKIFTREFHGYKYTMRVVPEDLGCLYLGPVKWDCQEGFTTPIALLSILAKGKHEDQGIELTEHDGSSTSYQIAGYEGGSIEIDERFRQFIVDVTKGKTLAEGLLKAGVIDEMTAQLVEQKASLPLPQPTGTAASAGKGKGENGDVMAALGGMGYKKGEIKGMVEAANIFPEMTLEEKVKAVLKT